jgi:hypothetical protein
VAVLREGIAKVHELAARIGGLSVLHSRELSAIAMQLDAALQSQQGASADRGEAVELGKLMVNSSGDFIGVKWNRPITIKNGQTVYAAPPSPAESAEGNGWTNGVRDNIGPQPLRWNITQSDPGAAPSGVSDAPTLDPQLAAFYQVDSVAGLLVALEEHIDKLQDTVRRNVKPWEDTFPPTLLPKYLRDSGLAAQPQPGRVEGMTWTDFDTMRHMLHCIAPVGEFTGKKTILRDSVIDIVSRFCRESASTAGGAS